MALSDDQRVLLRLLAQRENGYEDIAALKGKSVEEVREEVRSALAEMDVRPPEPEPPALEPVAPARSDPKKAPEPAPEPEQPTAEASTPAPKQSKAPKAMRRQPVPVERRRILMVAGGALAIVGIVLGAIAIIGGGSDSESSSGSSGSASGTETAFAESPTARNGKITRAILEPVDGSDAEGLAVFGRARKQVRLAVAAKGLEQAPNGQAYVVWLANSSSRMVPVTLAEVDESGEIAAQYPIPTAVLVYLAEGAFDEIDISLVSTARYKAAFEKARKENKLPAYTGADILRGKVVGPITTATKQQSGK